MASPDLQEPLPSIVSFSQLLERRCRPELGTEATEYLDFIIEGGLRMQSRITDLLSFSRSTTKGQPLTETDLGTVLHDVIQDLTGAIEAEGTTGETVSFTNHDRVIADRSSAEWIAEAPTYGRNRLLPLADFGPVAFMNASVTVNGRSGPISSAGWQYQPIIKESRNGSLKATPPALTAGGTGFTVVRDHP